MKNPSEHANLGFADSGGIAQLVERLVRNEKARGSNPLTSSPERFRGCRAVSLAKADAFLALSMRRATTRQASARSYLTFFQNNEPFVPSE